MDQNERQPTSDIIPPSVMTSEQQEQVEALKVIDSVELQLDGDHFPTLADLEQLLGSIRLKQHIADNVVSITNPQDVPEVMVRVKFLRQVVSLEPELSNRNGVLRHFFSDSKKLNTLIEGSDESFRSTVRQYVDKTNRSQNKQTVKSNNNGSKHPEIQDEADSLSEGESAVEGN
jgi:hypothetical protein